MQAVATRELELVCGGRGPDISIRAGTIQVGLVYAEQANVNLEGKDNRQSNSASVVQIVTNISSSRP